MASHLFAGVMDATLSHNEGWHFGHLGRMLERADKTARILDVKYFILLPSPQDVGTLLDELQWIALLRSASAYEMYRKQGKHRITPLGVAEFLILNAIFPRSIRHCLGRVESSLHKICGTPAGTWSNLAQRAIGRLSAELGYLTMTEIFEIGLHEFLDDLEQKMNHVDQQVFETFFALDAIVA